MSSASHAAIALAQELTGVIRFSGVRSVVQENVLEHIGFCALYALTLGMKACSAGYTCSLVEVLARAIVHDIEEGETGDIQRKTKYATKEIHSALENLAEVKAKTVMQALGLPYHFWENSKADDMEGAIVRLADLAAVVSKIEQEYVTLGNKSFKGVRDDIRVLIANHLASPWPKEKLLRDELLALAAKLERTMP